MAVLGCRVWGGRWRFGVLPLLSLLITLQSFRGSCLDSPQDAATCSHETLDQPMVLKPGRGMCSLASDWSPWSWQPLCPDVEEDDGLDPPDCVFTHEAFRGNQGISLITTPDLAASVVDYLDDSGVPLRIRDELSISMRQEDSRAGYEIRDLPGRGKGVVARRRFAQHETVMVDFPVLVVRLDFINGERSDRQKRHMLEASVRRLSPKQQTSIASLARSTGGGPILDAIRTNGFGIEIDSVQHLALFIDGSVRMGNHTHDMQLAVQADRDMRRLVRDSTTIAARSR